MNFHPTSFFILENVELGTFWISQTKMRLGTNGQSLLASITRNQLIDKLVAKYVNYDLPCIDVVSINKNGFVPFYGLERWLSKLDYKIKQSPKKYEELDKLLKAGWHRSDTISHSKINVLQAQNPTDLQKLYKRLIIDWEAKGLRCLNALRCKTDKEKYEDKKQDPNFMYNKARKEVLRQIKKTGKRPKQSTIDKYELKNFDIKEVMEEVVLCQPCEKEFYKKNGRWHCFCNKRIDGCRNTECKNEGMKLKLKVGAKMCEHNRYPSKCKSCNGGSFCDHNKLRYTCIQCGVNTICEHNRRRTLCTKCGGSQICEHNRERSRCKPCGGSQICQHGRQRSKCRECSKGSFFCEHNKRRVNCKDCKGSNICPHNKEKQTCKICNPQSYIACLRRSRRCNATRTPNPTHTLDDLCMTLEEWLKYLHKTFEDRYGRPKTEKDEVHIDEIIPCSAWNLPDDNKYCWHYLNSQWLLAEDNLSKHNSFEEEDKLAMIERIQSSTYTSSSEIG
jgi:hypothetical protein